MDELTPCAQYRNLKIPTMHSSSWRRLGLGENGRDIALAVEGCNNDSAVGMAMVETLRNSLLFAVVS